MSLRGAENFPLNFLLAVEDRMSRPMDTMRRGQERFFRGAERGGRQFVGTYDRMSRGLRNFNREWRQTRGVMGRGRLMLRGVGQSLMFGLVEPLRALPGLAGSAGKALAGLGVAAVGIGMALVAAAVRYKKFFLDLNEAMFLSGKQMGQLQGLINGWTAELGHSRTEVKETVKVGLELGFMLGKTSSDIRKFTKHTLVLSKATGIGTAAIGRMYLHIHKLYNLGWHGVRQFGLAFKYTADMTSISADELSSFVSGMGNVLAVLPGKSRKGMVAITQDLVMLQGALRDFDVNADGVMSAFTQSMRMSSEEGHRMLQMLAGMLGEDSRELRRRFADSPREFVFALSDSLKKLEQKTPVVRDLLEREFEQAFGISLRDIRGLQRMTRKGLLGTLKKIEEATRKARLEEQTRTKMMEKLTQAWGKLIAQITPLLAEIGLPLLKKLTEVAPDMLRAAAKWAAEDFPTLFKRLVSTIGNMINAVNWDALGTVISRTAELIGKLMVKVGLIDEEELHPERKLSRAGKTAVDALTQRRLFEGATNKVTLSTLLYGVAFKDGQSHKDSAKFGRAAALSAVLGAERGMALGEIEKAIRQLPAKERSRILKDLKGEESLPGWMVPRMAEAMRTKDIGWSGMDKRGALRMMVRGRQRMGILLEMLSENPARMFERLSRAKTVGGALKSRARLRTEFDRAAKKYGVPRQLLESVGRRESAFSMKATSRVGAKGIMQLMPGTAAEMRRRLKLKADPMVDQRANIAAGAGLLRALLKKYDGDVVLALAAYNWGTGNVSRVLAQADGDANKALLSIPIETRRYANDILSDALVMTDKKMGTETTRTPQEIRQLDAMIRVLQEIRDQGKAANNQVAPGVAPLPQPMSEAKRTVLRRSGR